MHIQVLGGFSIVFGEEPVNAINTPRLQSLLTYLILNANLSQSRQHVAFLLWPDTSESNARNNLRQYLHQLRRLLPDPERFLTAGANTLCWHQDQDQSIDVQYFASCLAEAGAAEGRADLKAAQQWLAEALSTYRGDLLPSCYDSWILPARETLRQQFINAHQKLARILEQQRDYPAALQAVQSLLRLDPLDESTYITLMRLYEFNQNRSAARRVYQTAAKTLRRELGVEPGEALQQAYERLQHAPEANFLARESLPSMLVGRQAEWQQLLAAWQHAADGNTHFALITGEAGIGKSRLAEELFNWAAQQGFNAVHTRSYAAEGRLSLAPVTEWLRSPRLRPHLKTLDKVWLTEVARVLPEILSEHPHLARPEPVGEYGQRQRFFEALARAVFCAPRPLLLWIDDLQWCDPDTLEWLHFLLRFEPHSPLLVLGTARSEESPPDHPLVALARQLRLEGRLASIELSPLDAAETAKLASQVAQRELDEAEAIFLHRETEGNPLFIVETVRVGLGSPFAVETASRTRPDQESHALPPRVHAVIAERLAQLPPLARKVAELGAAIGRAFTFDTLLQAGKDDEASIVQALDELWQKRIVREQGTNVFDFTHDKLREVAYEEISAPKRRLLHRHIAQALETLHADNLDEVSAQVAAQYEQAGMFAQALPYYQRAGAVAAGVYANNEAISLLERALALLAQLPPGEKRDAQELTLQLSLAPLYRITEGWASPDTARVAERARILGDKVGSVAQRVQTLFLQQTVNVVAARFDQVLQTEHEIRRLVEGSGGSPEPFANLIHAGTLSSMGHFMEARELFAPMLAGLDEGFVWHSQSEHGVNYLAHAYVWNSHALWCLGYPQQAIEGCEEGVRVAREFAQPFSQGLAITYLAMLQELRASAPTFQAQAEDALTFTRKYQVFYYLAWANILVQFTQAWKHPDDGSLARLRGAIHAFTESGARIRLPYYYSLLARACQRAERIGDGLAALEQAFAASQQNQEQWWDAELHRLRGELLWSQGADASEVEAAFRRSIEKAQSQKAKSLELRAATSLARLWLFAGRPEAARQLLGPVYNWFTEGFDTPDLQAAKSLITQL